MAAVVESMHAMHHLQLQGPYTGLAGVKLPVKHIYVVTSHCKGSVMCEVDRRK